MVYQMAYNAHILIVSSSLKVSIYTHIRIYLQVYSYIIPVFWYLMLKLSYLTRGNSRVLSPAQATSFNISECVQVHDVKVEVVEGDARNVLCDAVEKHHASILVVGSHGYGAIKRYCSKPLFLFLLSWFTTVKL